MQKSMVYDTGRIQKIKYKTKSCNDRSTDIDLVFKQSVRRSKTRTNFVTDDNKSTVKGHR